MTDIKYKPGDVVLLKVTLTKRDAKYEDWWGEMESYGQDDLLIRDEHIVCLASDYEAMRAEVERLRAQVPQIQEGVQETARALSAAEARVAELEEALRNAETPLINACDLRGHDSAVLSLHRGECFEVGFCVPKVAAKALVAVRAALAAKPEGEEPYDDGDCEPLSGARQVSDHADPPAPKPDTAREEPGKDPHLCWTVGCQKAAMYCGGHQYPEPNPDTARVERELVERLRVWCSVMSDPESRDLADRLAAALEGK